MVEVEEIGNLLQNSLHIPSGSESESEWDELEIGSEIDEIDEIPSLPPSLPPSAHSTLIANRKKPRLTLSRRADLGFPCARVLKNMKSRDSSKKVQRGKFKLLFVNLKTYKENLFA